MTTLNNNNNKAEAKPAKLVGSIPELGDAVFTIGEKNSLNNFDNIKRRIANHVGSALDTSMCDMMLYDMEQTFDEPTRPTSKAVTRSDSDDDVGNKSHRRGGRHDQRNHVHTANILRKRRHGCHRRVGWQRNQRRGRVRYR